MSFLSSIAAVALLALSSMAHGGDRITGAHFATRSEVIAPHAMAATSHPLATQVALDIMRAGGNAIDAAIAANATLGLMEPTGNGIGGDLFAIVWDAKSKKLYGLNASGRSPQSLSLEYFIDNGHERVPSHGPLPVSVPGAVDGWFELHDRFGKLSMKRTLAPAITYAKEGFPITELIAYYWNRSVPLLQKYPGFSDTYMPNGRAPKKGEIFRNPALADTYKTLAEKGRDGFYKGRIARTIADYVQAQGGFLSEKDLSDHRSEWVKPESTNYRGYEVWELPPNGQGIAALQILNILEAYDLASMGHDSAEYVHVFTEAKKLAFEDRARYYADMDFFQTPVAKLISKQYAAERRELIDLDRAAKSYPAGELGHGDTIYLTVADRDGNMVSLIQSNYRGMGSGMTPPGLGFILQDRGELFSLKRGHPNVFAPGKRPFHTIIPAFVTKDGRPWMSFGLMGGGMQPQGHAQIVINLVDFRMNLQEAGDAARIRHQGSSQPTDEAMSDGGTLYLESGFSEATVRRLAKMGHKIGSSAGGYGGYQAIRWDAGNGVYIGASESRKDGHAAGY
ncbi:MAG: gamma-glutamyltransferase [Gammaproteobacteria bacterium]|nr:gamma-glutamyltransferase [Gammaproteobacteria bacterium]